MGLDTSHDCWHGAYSAFMRWRQAVAKAAGIGNLNLMEGFYGGEGGGISWALLGDDPLVKLLHHSDCEGSLDAVDCGPIADRLESLLPALDAMGDGGGHVGGYGDKTRTFIAGLRLAASRGEDVEFH